MTGIFSLINNIIFEKERQAFKELLLFTLMQTNNYQDGEMIISKKDKTTAGILGILLGGLGVHRMYMGFIGIGLLQLILTILTLGIAAVWGFIEGILILVQDDWTDSEGQLLKGNERGQQAYYDGVSRGLKPPVGGSKPQVGGNNNKFQQLKELNELKEQGIITQEEFEQEKRKIL